MPMPSAHSVLGLLPLLLGFPRQGCGQPDGQVIEVEFEPIGPGGGTAAGPPPELLEMLGLGGAGPPRGGRSGASTHGREDELDRALEGMIGSMLGSVGAPPPQLIHGGKGGGGRSGEANDGRLGAEVMIEESPMIIGGPGGGPEMMMAGPMLESRSSMPVQAFRDLFPGPLLVEEGPMEMSSSSPFGGPDPLVMDMLQDLSRAFQDDMLPAIHAAGRSRAPDSCGGDLKKHCSSARSQLHCLGQHNDDISDKCRQDVGKSVPFVCSKAIDRFCDVLQSGILKCLGERLGQGLDASCKDAVLATRQVIGKANTQKVSLVDRKSGAKKVVAPPAASPKQREATLDSQLGKPAATLLAPPAKAAERPHLVPGASGSGAAVAAGAAPAALQPPTADRAGTWRCLYLASLFAAVAIAACALLAPETAAHKRAAAWLLPSRGEGRQPLRGGVELPKPAELSA